MSTRFRKEALCEGKVNITAQSAGSWAPSQLLVSLSWGFEGKVTVHFWPCHAPDAASMCQC